MYVMLGKYNTLYVLFLLFLLIISSIPIYSFYATSLNKDLSSLSDSMGNPYLIEHFRSGVEQIVKNYALFTHDNQLLMLYSYGINTSIIYGNFSFTVSTPYGKPAYYVFNKYLLILEHGSDVIHIVLYNLDNVEKVLDKMIDTGNLVVSGFNGIYYDNLTNQIHIYTTMMSLNGNTYLEEIIIDPISKTIIQNQPALISKMIYCGNIFYGTRSNIYPSTILIDHNVTISISSNETTINVDGETRIFNGTPIITPPLIVVNTTFIIPLNSTNTLVLAIYDDTKNIFYTIPFPISINEFSLYGFYPLGNFLSIIYYAVANKSLLINYFNVINNATHRLFLNSTNPRITLFLTDHDNDTYPEPIIKWNEYYVLTYTKLNKSNIIYWDHLLQHIASKYDTVYLNNTVYFMFAYKNNTASSVIELLRFNENTTVDYSPPVIHVVTPRNESIVSNPILINASFIDNESAVYITEVSILNQSNDIVFSTYTKHNQFFKEINLDEGTYTLEIKSWNTYGFSSYTNIVFRVLGSHVKVVNPINQSIVGAIYTLEILSDSTYKVEIYINNSILANYTLTQGTNYILINTTILPDGPYYLDLRVQDLNYTIRLFLVKDSNPPIIIIRGLTNNTVVNGILNLTIIVNDEHFKNLSVILDSKILFETDIAGEHGLLLNTIEYPNGEHYLIFKAVDLAGNLRVVMFRIIFNNTYEQPVLSINPEPLNNTFIEGTVRFNISGNRVFLVNVYIDDKLFLSIPSINGRINANIVIDTSQLLDGIHEILINASCYYGENIVYKYVWFVDNHPPKLYMRIPVIGVGGSWRNNSVVPRFNPIRRDITYVTEYDGSYLIPLYVNISDAFLENATLYINNSIARIVIDNNARLGVFNEDVGYLFKLMVPGEGYYILKLKGIDSAGHSSNYIIGFYLDLHKPIVNILSPINDTYTNNRSILFRFQVFDNISKRIFAGVNIQKDKYKPPSLDDYMPITYLGFTVGKVINQSIEFRSDGTYYVSFIFIDEGMNYRIVLLKLVIDRKPPAINITINKLDNEYFAEINVSDKYSPIKYAEIIVDGSVLKNVSSTNKSLITKIKLEPGIHNLTIISIDKSGNKAVVSKIVEITGTNTSESTTSIPNQSITMNTTSKTISNNNSINNWIPTPPIYLYISIIVAIATLLVLVIWFRKKRR